jgi:hypothetical protein
MVEELDSDDALLPGCGGQSNRTRCFDHITNLMARTITKVFDAPKSKKEGILDDAEKELADLVEGLDLEDLMTRMEDSGEADDNVEGWVDELEEMTCLEREDVEATVRPLTLVLVKVGSESCRKRPTPHLHSQLRKFSFALLRSTTRLLPEWFKALETLEMAVRKMPRDVATRWNSTFLMLDFALSYRTAIDQMAANKNNDLRKYELTADDWRLATQLRDSLKVRIRSLARSPEEQRALTSAQIFSDATLFFSRATPNLASVIPAMDHIDERLATDALNKDLEPSIRIALTLAKKTLNRYYEKTDQSFLYRTAMGTLFGSFGHEFPNNDSVLHPRYKLEYFKLVHWEQEWIDAALELVRWMYIDVYSKREPQHTAGNVQVTADVGVPKQVREVFPLTAIPF